MPPTTESRGRVALAIETITPDADEEPEYGDPDDYELLAVALAYDGPRNPTVGTERLLLRDDPSPDAELDLFQRLLSALTTYDPATIVTFGGEEFDLPILLGRPIRANDEQPGYAIRNNLDTLVESFDHQDLAEDAREAYGDDATLEDVLRGEGLEPTETRFDDVDHGLDLAAVRSSESAVVGNDDVANVGEVWLHARSPFHDDIGPCRVEPTRELIERHAMGEVEHLFDLADARPFGE